MKKIMFNDKYGLTMAVQIGLKTQTRRMVPESTQRMADMECRTFKDKTFEECVMYHSYFLLHEHVAIAQSYKDAFSQPLSSLAHEFRFRMYNPQLEKSKGYTNKMFVKAEYMPHHIRIKNIRVEHLQDISDADCLKEGISMFNHNWGYFGDKKDSKIPSFHVFGSVREAFASLIDKVSGKGTWDSNPLVYVYDIECID